MEEIRQGWLNSHTTSGIRSAAPRACILDKPHLAQFLSQALTEAGVVTFTCSNKVSIAAALAEYRPDLVVLGSVADGIAALRAIEALASQRFNGLVLLIGQPAAPVTNAVQKLGVDLGLNMLPLLKAPFTQSTLRSAVAGLLGTTDAPIPAPDLDTTLNSTWLELWYQPKLAFRSFSLQGAEALVRMRHPRLGLLQPADFLPSADDERLIGLSRFVIRQALADWAWFLDRHGPLEIAINLPLICLRDPRLMDELVAQIPSHPRFDGLIIETNAAELLGN